MIKTPHFVLSLDPATGAIIRLKDRKTGREWASAANPLGLFSYQTFAMADYQRFFDQYIKTSADWARLDFGKPGLDKYPAQSRLWQPVKSEALGGRAGRGVSDRNRPAHARGRRRVGSGGLAGAHDVGMTLPDNDPAIHLQFQWFGKARQPSAGSLVALLYRSRRTRTAGCWTKSISRSRPRMSSAAGAGTCTRSRGASPTMMHTGGSA